MKREAELERRLRSLRALGEAVTAMKSLSAHHFREARAAVAEARAYREGVDRILDWTGAPIAAGEGGAGLLVVGAELGLCGGHDARIVEAGQRTRAELGEGPTLCVGHHAASLLGRRGVELERAYTGPTGVRGLTALLLELAEDILTTYAGRGLASFDIVSSRFGGVGATTPERVRLLPIERPPEPGAPRFRHVDRDNAVWAAVREFLYITLYDLLLDALASEHGARLVATQGAESWLDRSRETLKRRLMATRREAATQEVIEIAAGVRARARR